MDGTLQLSINLILYLIVIIFFTLSKRNKYFGLRFKKCFLSEKLWHKMNNIIVVDNYKCTLL